MSDWQTSVSVDEGKVLIRGYDLEALIGAVVHLLVLPAAARPVAVAR